MRPKKVKPANSKSLADNKAIIGAIIAAIATLTVGVLANLPNIHRFFFQGPEYTVLQEQATVEIGKKIGFDGVSMVPHEVSGSEPTVYFDVVAPAPVTSPTEHVSVGSPLYLHADGNKYAIHVLALTGTSPKTLLLKIEKKTR